MHAFPELGYGGADIARAVIAHDNEWIALYHKERTTIERWQKEVERANYIVLADGAA